MNVFVIKEGVVYNRITADSLERAQEYHPDALCVDADTTDADIGWPYVGGQFIKPPDPQPPRGPLTKLQLLLRMPPAKRMSIRAARFTDAIVADAMDLLDAAEYVSVEDPTTIQFVGYLVSAGLLTADEGAAVLA